MDIFNNIYRNKKVLVTGHTGFKGSWLTLWLKQLGATVVGISLPPETQPSHIELLNLDIESQFIDICDYESINSAISRINPDIVFHLAAQALVRRSYTQPLQTWSTNVIGTANVLEACRNALNVSAIVVVTTDKCYENKEWVWGYREIDPLGGHDIYSASKAGTELVAASFKKSFFNNPNSPLLATARAGNVIGGGDWSEDRLIPDLVRAIENHIPLEIRFPYSTRPWQHVLECLSGYLILGQQLLERNFSCADAWNFGPELNSNRTVEQMLIELKKTWPKATWKQNNNSHPHEAKLLHLDSSKALHKLHWKPVWSFEEGVGATALWYDNWLANHEVISLKQLNDYTNLARKQNLSWAQGLSELCTV